MMRSSLNGKVLLQDITISDDQNFECLKPLGEPLDIWERHSIAGDEYKFYYDGFTLAYHNTDDASVMTLAYIEINKEKIFSSTNNIQINVGDSLRNLFNDSTKEQLSFSGNETHLVKFYDNEGSKMLIKTNDGRIKEIKIWL